MPAQTGGPAPLAIQTWPSVEPACGIVLTHAVVLVATNCVDVSMAMLTEALLVSASIFAFTAGHTRHGFAPWLLIVIVMPGVGVAGSVTPLAPAQVPISVKGVVKTVDPRLAPAVTLVATDCDCTPTASPSAWLTALYVAVVPTKRSTGLLAPLLSICALNPLTGQTKHGCAAWLEMATDSPASPSGERHAVADGARRNDGKLRLHRRGIARCVLPRARRKAAGDGPHGRGNRVPLRRALAHVNTRVANGKWTSTRWCRAR